MRKYSSNILIITLCCFFLIAVHGEAFSKGVEVGYLENVVLGKIPGKERIALVVSQQPTVSVENKADGNLLLIKLADMFVPDNLRCVFGENELDNISRITAVQQAIDGRQWAYLNIFIKKSVPYAVKQEGKNIYIDFNVAMLPEAKNNFSSSANAGVAKNTSNHNGFTKKYTGKLISLDFQDADIKSVLRLMAEYGNMSIVSGEDVKGNVTLTMKNVPWGQALDTILDINGLAKKQMGDVISVMTLEKKKRDEESKRKSEEDQIVAEGVRRAREQKLLVEKGKLKQILIEAKIVEATEGFVRNLGVQWGCRYKSVCIQRRLWSWRNGRYEYFNNR